MSDLFVQPNNFIGPHPRGYFSFRSLKRSHVSLQEYHCSRRQLNPFDLDPAFIHRSDTRSNTSMNASDHAISIYHPFPSMPANNHVRCPNYSHPTFSCLTLAMRCRGTLRRSMTNCQRREWAYSSLLSLRSLHFLNLLKDL